MLGSDPCGPCNETVRGTEQAFREIVRVLKPGGEFRGIGIRASRFKRIKPLFDECFELVERKYVPREIWKVKGDQLLFIVARRKEVSPERFAAIKKESTEWKQKHIRVDEAPGVESQE